MTDEELLREALEALEGQGCQFWACEGPTLKPLGMTTCQNCYTRALIAKRLGIYVPRSKRRINQEADRRYRSFQVAKHDFEMNYRMNH